MLQRVVRWRRNDPAVISHTKFSYSSAAQSCPRGAPTNRRVEHRWVCGGDGCAIMRYGYPGLPCALTPSHKRDTITSVNAERQKEKKAPAVLSSQILLASIKSSKCSHISCNVEAFVSFYLIDIVREMVPLRCSLQIQF